MTESSSRPTRKVAIADHLWDAFAEMAQVMGSDREALINQAMFMFARLNGFLDSEEAARAARASRTQVPRPAGGGTLAGFGPPIPGLTPSGSSRVLPPEERSVRVATEAARKQVADRVMETAAELERLMQQERPGAGAGPGEATAVGEGGAGPGEVLAEALAARTGQDTVPPIGAAGGALHLLTDAGEPVRVAKERFVIGRGKHCDLVIQSSKVSREHAAITREGEAYFIEDLDSSNGTWFNKQRIKRRRVEPGDEYFICSERIQVVLR
jgi:hypothetical protein